MADLIIKCPKCSTDNPIDFFKAEEGSKVLCRGCNEFIILRFKDGRTPQKIKEEIANELRKSLSNIRVKL